ncbi:MAG: calcium/proton exchanger [Candidatus Melainabacteria bacterium]|nr:MAG: calcium/proton exchanger [Candidatus Melainabacteria bacterium]
MIKLDSTTVLNALLIFVPVPMIGAVLGFPPAVIFITAGIAIIPLANLMGRATEFLAERVGVGLGSVVNSTFGNACELIIGCAALRAGLIDVVEASITGSIIGNVLLVLGASILAGGLKYEKQVFNRTAATTAATLLALAAISLTVPTVFHYTARAAADNATKLALVISVVLFVTYILGLVFSLKTHKDLYLPSQDAEVDAALGISSWSVKKSLLVLFVSAVLVAILSEYLVHAIAETATTLGVSKIFIGVILVAIIGNAAEHSTAVLMAMRNKMDLAINIALGSGTQIALFVAPILVFVSFLLGAPMDLCFTELEVLSIAVSVIILAFIATDGECNWLEGVQLLAVYLVLGAAFYFS